MTRSQMIDVLIRMREDAYDDNVIISSEQPRFYWLVVQMIMELEKEWAWSPPNPL